LFSTHRINTMHKLHRGTACVLGALFALTLMAGCERRQPTPDVTTTTPPAETATTPTPAPTPAPVPDMPASAASPAWPASPASQ
jgi:hypothetical protein